MNITCSRSRSRASSGQDLRHNLQPSRNRHQSDNRTNNRRKLTSGSGGYFENQTHELPSNPQLNNRNKKSHRSAHRQWGKQQWNTQNQDELYNYNDNLSPNDQWSGNRWHRESNAMELPSYRNRLNNQTQHSKSSFVHKDFAGNDGLFRGSY